MCHASGQWHDHQRGGPVSSDLFLTALRLDKVELGARMNMPQISFFLLLSRFQERKILTDQNQQRREIGNTNDRPSILTKNALILYPNTLLAVISLLRDASDLALDRRLTYPIENLSGLLRMIIHAVNLFN
jgi:hypothetical protein